VTAKSDNPPIGEAGAFSRLRALAVGLADRARPDGSLGKPPDRVRQHVTRKRCLRLRWCRVLCSIGQRTRPNSRRRRGGRPGIPADLFLLFITAVL